MPSKLERVERYLSLLRENVKLKGFLGDGTDGAVWATSRDSAIKVFDRPRGYFNERDAYLNLRQFGYTEKIGEFWVPQLIAHSDELMVVEMDIMHERPYIIDFAKVSLNFPPPYPDHVLAEMEMECRALFEDNWPAVQVLLDDLRGALIYYLDPKPHNIVFPSKNALP